MFPSLLPPATTHLSALPILANCVDVWESDLDTGQWDDSALWDFLSSPEHDRAARYRFPRDKKRFLRRRFLLKTLLGFYLDMPAREISLQELPGNKPTLSGKNIHFNISHSKGLCLLAFSREVPLGIDVEATRHIDELSQIAEHHFSPTEHDTLLHLPQNGQVAAFYHIWTQKEAFVKTIGQGLSLPLSCFDVQTDPQQPGGILACRPPLPAAINYAMHTFIPSPGFMAALCYSGPALDVHRYSLKERNCLPSP